MTTKISFGKPSTCFPMLLHSRDCQRTRTRWKRNNTSNHVGLS